MIPKPPHSKYKEITVKEGTAGISDEQKSDVFEFSELEFGSDKAITELFEIIRYDTDICSDNFGPYG